MLYALHGVQRALKGVDVTSLPVLAIGYSRGGAMAVEYGAVAPGNDVPVPDRIMSVFPGRSATSGGSSTSRTLERQDRGCSCRSGRTTGSWTGRARRLCSSGCSRPGSPAENIDLDVVRSKIGFTSDHFAPMATSAAAQAAFWAPADKLLEQIQ